VDFIERVFGVSPDGGNGTEELLWLAAIITVVAAAVLFRRILSRRNRS
jgi:hypothetical protein